MHGIEGSDAVRWTVPCRFGTSTVTECSRWLEAGYPLESIAVNISATNLGSGDFIRGVRETVMRYGSAYNTLGFTTLRGDRGMTSPPAW